MTHRITLGRRSVLAAALSAGLAVKATAHRDASHVAVDEVLGRYRSAGIPGAVIAIGDSKGPMLIEAAGLDDARRGTRLHAAQALGIGSCTKTFVAVAAMRLVEEGRLDLGTTVADAVGVDLTRDIGNAGTATLEQAMSHMSGVPSWEEQPRWIHDVRGAGFDPDRRWAPRDALDYVRGVPPIVAPGLRFSYSNTNYTLLGLAIERASGRRLSDEIATRILGPGQLRHSWMTGFTRPAAATPTARRYHYATPGFAATAGLSPYFPRVGSGLIDVSASSLTPEWAAGAMMATAADLLRFATSLRNGALVTARSLAFMQRWRATGEESDFSYVGHGLGRRSMVGRWWIGHSGDVLGSTAQFYWAEDADLVVAVLADVGTMHTKAAVPGASEIANDPVFLRAAVARSLSRAGRAAR